MLGVRQESQVETNQNLGLGLDEERNKRLLHWEVLNSFICHGPKVATSWHLHWQVVTNSALKGRLLILVTTWLGLKDPMVVGRGQSPRWHIVFIPFMQHSQNDKARGGWQVSNGPGTGKKWVQVTRLGTKELLVTMEQFCMGVAVAVARIYKRAEII